jgi:hypothetical protein
VWGWVGEGAREGVGMSMYLRVCARGEAKSKGARTHLYTHPQEVRVARVQDEVVRDEAEVAGHNRLPGICAPPAHEPHVVHARPLDEPRRVHRV